MYDLLQTSWFLFKIIIFHKFIFDVINIHLISIFLTGCNQNLVSNGYCNDNNNNLECDYDGGDCCLTNLKTDHCSICSCSQNGVVMSTGYPQYYLEDQDLTWLLQVPIGHHIKIVFISFDVGPGCCCKYVFLIVFR